MDRYICIHCHFYQPPRENPWLEAVELQDSAYPYHDWNERITAECYAPNSASRILDAEGKIAKITNNYSRISYNFGPTLLSWMEDNAPQVYHAVLDADRISREMFSGHGSAMAQAYNHMILPLATRRDKETQVRWGIRDFESRFGRRPEGLWLPETAVDLETLEVLVDYGIEYTVLAPSQAGKIRERGAKEWINLDGGDIDPTRAYFCTLPSGRTINLFFYDGPISRAVAFEKLLNSGETLAARLLSGFSDARQWPQLMHIATDGETYGHHHPHGDMALGYALEHIETNELAKITNYGEFLEKFPPTQEAQIIENTAWSCAHGVGRWFTDCGCNSGGNAGWDQKWRTPLRQALDWLRDDLASPYEDAARVLLKDPWAARNEYIGVVLDRSPRCVDEFLGTHATRELSHDEQVRALELLEMQRHLLLMYTSCGWFFDELSGIETVQVVQYAGRAVQLANELFDGDREQKFIERLRQAKSNIPDIGDGAQVYERFVRPAMVDLVGVGAHFAISSMFEDFGAGSPARAGSAREPGSPPSAAFALRGAGDAVLEHRVIYCYGIDLEDRRNHESGRARVALGRVRIESQITRESMDASFGVLHFGDHNLSAGIREFAGDAAFEETAKAVADAFNRSDLPDCIRILDRHFAGTSYSLKSLFRDQQRRIVNLILNSTLSEAEASYAQIYDHHAPLLRFLEELRAPMPKVLRLTAEFVVNRALRREFESETFDLERIRTLLDTAQRENTNLDAAGLEFVLRRRLNRMVDTLAADPGDIELLATIDAAVAMARALPFAVNLWKVQNVYYQLLQSEFAQRREQEQWLRLFLNLGEQLGMRPPAIAEKAPVAA